MRKTLLLIIAAAFFPAAFAQHETAFDVVSGQQAYMQVCANCHGPDGNLIANVDLGHGVFRRPYTDEQLVAIIKNGIPNTPMPANPAMSVEQAAQIVAYLRSRAVQQTDALAGDAARGKTLFEGRGDCLSCHAVNGTGSPLGPELTKIGALRSAAELQQSLLQPQQQIQPNSRTYAVITREGERVTGRLLNHDAFSVQLLDSDARLRSFMKQDLRQSGFAESQMPSLQDQYSAQEIADLVEYLASLRGIP
jgi:putative heme-binding domain-containing protein